MRATQQSEILSEATWVCRLGNLALGIDLDAFENRRAVGWASGVQEYWSWKIDLGKRLVCDSEIVVLAKALRAPSGQPGIRCDVGTAVRGGF